MIFPGRIKLLPPNEMPQVYKIDKAKGVQIKKGDWVRMKNGLYHDDLGLVAATDGTKAIVKVIPRIDYSAAPVKPFQKKDEAAKKKEKFKMQARPMQKLFSVNSDEVEKQ
jgi:hypothetical protein